MHVCMYHKHRNYTMHAFMHVCMYVCMYHKHRNYTKSQDYLPVGSEYGLLWSSVNKALWCSVNKATDFKHIGQDQMASESRHHLFWW